MAVPGVDKRLLCQLEEMGFPEARATRALHFSGNSSIEAAISWIIDHENDADIDEMPLVCLFIVTPSLIYNSCRVQFVSFLVRHFSLGQMFSKLFINLICS